MSRRRAFALAALRILVPLAVFVVAIRLLDDSSLAFVAFLLAWPLGMSGMMLIARRRLPTRSYFAFSLIWVVVFLAIVLLGGAR